MNEKQINTPPTGRLTGYDRGNDHDSNEFEIDPPPTDEEREFARLALEYARHLEQKKEKERLQ